MPGWIAILTLGLTACCGLALKAQQMERRALFGNPNTMRGAAARASGDIPVDPPDEYQERQSKLKPSWSVSPATQYVRSH